MTRQSRTRRLLLGTLALSVLALAVQTALAQDTRWEKNVSPNSVSFAGVLAVRKACISARCILAILTLAIQRIGKQRSSTVSAHPARGAVLIVGLENQRSVLELCEWHSTTTIGQQVRKGSPACPFR